MKKSKLTKNQFRKMIQEEISKLTLEAETMRIDPRDVSHARKHPEADSGFLEGLEKIFVELERSGRTAGEYAVNIAHKLGYKNYFSPYDWTEPVAKHPRSGISGDKSGFWKRFNEEKERLGDKFPYEVVDTLAADYGDVGGDAEGDDRWKIVKKDVAENNYHEIGSPPNPKNNLGMGSISEKKTKITKGMILQMLQEEFQNIMSEGEYEDAINALAGDAEEAEEDIESTEFAEAIAALETMHQNLEGIIARLKEVPGAPLGTDIAMALSGLDPES